MNISQPVLTLEDLVRQTQSEFMRQYNANAIRHPDAHQAAKEYVFANKTADWLENQNLYWSKFNELTGALQHA